MHRSFKKPILRFAWSFFIEKKTTNLSRDEKKLICSNQIGRCLIRDQLRHGVVIGYIINCSDGALRYNLHNYFRNEKLLVQVIPEGRVRTKSSVFSRIKELIKLNLYSVQLLFRDNMDFTTIDGDKDTDNISKDFVNLEAFRFRELLGEDSTHKVAFVLLDVNGCSNQAILIVERSPFPVKEQDWNTIVSQCSLKTVSINDIYSNHILFPPEKFAGIKTTLINPCTEKHIAKYRDQKRYVIHETPDDYKSITLTYLEGHQFTLKWIFNLLDHKAEMDRVIYDDIDPQNGFMLAPDLKWDGQDLSNLYVLAIIRRKGIKSIRDLTANDLPLLENICEKSYAAIKKKYGIDEHQIRAYFHYQPSFYHLHVHFIHVSYDAPASGVAKAHLLEDVINNIRLVPDYYQRSTLTFTVKENDPLLKLYRDAYRW
uniref:m7GpppX diphosphatase n=1 Tax=Setaria digitata TaxID=48799 RepID=A0A915PSN8_9BILA